MKQLRHFLFFGVGFLIFFYGSTILDSSKKALTLWFEVLVPSMFVSLICIRYLYYQGLFPSLNLPLLEKTFHMNQYALSLFFCILLLGFPNGALLIEEAYQQQRLTHQQAKRLLYTCSIASPGFILISCGIGIFQSAQIGWRLFLIQIAAVALLLLITRSTPISMLPLQTETKSLKAAMLDSGLSLFMLGGYLMLVTSITAVICLWLSPSQCHIVQMLSEFSSGIFLSMTLPYPLVIKQLLICILLSFGGFCVHLQTRSLCSFPYSYACYCGFRILQAVLASILFLFLL